MGSMAAAPRQRGSHVTECALTADMATMLLRIKAKPGARESGLTQAPDGSWLATLKSPPVDGKANGELITLVARHFRCHKAAVSIKSGSSGRMKLVKVTTS
jgi:uncharacterized protein (TIGR00251 family)